MAGNKKQSDQGREAILRYLDRHGVVDKDAGRSARSTPKKPPRPTAAQRRRGAPDFRLDLHGMTEEEARLAVGRTLDTGRLRGWKKLLIVHGHGLHALPNEPPVLKKMVRRMLEHERTLSIRGFRPGLPREGGEGVTVVDLR